MLVMAFLRDVDSLSNLFSLVVMPPRAAPMFSISEIDVINVVTHHN